MSNPAGTTAPLTPTDHYVILMVESHNAPTIAASHNAERRARAIAKRHGLNEFDLEPAVLAAVFESMSDDELVDAAADPSRRTMVRAEQRRRAELADALELEPTALDPIVDLGAVTALLNGNANVNLTAHVTSLGGNLAAIVLTGLGAHGDLDATVCIDEAPRVFDTAEHGAARLMGVELETEANGGERSWEIGRASTSLEAARVIARAHGDRF